MVGYLLCDVYCNTDYYGTLCIMKMLLPISLKQELKIIALKIIIVDFCQGEKSSRDEQGACAMLATQLDSFLGGEPVQHRQVQGYESPEFMALFPKGVSYKVRE